MIIVFLGPPGAGKGTQCKRVAERYGLQHLSSGDILRRERQEQSDLGKQAESYMDSGQLVPDELIVKMMTAEIAKTDGASGVILDGFPRTIDQAEELDRALGQAGKKVDLVLNLHVDDDKLEARITGRRSCSECGAAYHIEFNPPRDQDRCDKPGCGKIVQRPDDTAQVVRTRISNYHTQTAPLVDFYSRQQNLRSIDGNADINQVTSSILEVVGSLLAVS